MKGSEERFQRFMENQQQLIDNRKTAEWVEKGEGASREKESASESERKSVW